MERRQRELKKKVKRIALLASLSALLAIGTTAAFLTSRDVAENWFTVAKVDLDLTENFDENKTLAAGEIITKQPSIKNTGTVNQLFFAMVCVPVMNTTLVDGSGARIAPGGTVSPTTAADYRQDAEIFNLLSTETSYETVTHTPEDSKFGTFNYNNTSGTSAGWHFLKTGASFTVSQTNKLQGFVDGTYNVYFFGYNSWVAPDNSTIPIFDKLQLRSMVDGDIEGETVGQVTIRAYTVQADELNISNLAGNGSTTPYTKEDLAQIFKVCVNREGITTGD